MKKTILFALCVIFVFVSCNPAVIVSENPTSGGTDNGGNSSGDCGTPVPTPTPTPTPTPAPTPKPVYRAGDAAFAKIKIGDIYFDKTEEVYVTGPNGATIIGKTNADNFEGVFIEGRTVTLNPFIMGKYEVTQELYTAVMTGQKVTIDGVEKTLSANPSRCIAGSAEYALANPGVQKLRPVEGVTWYDTVYFCNALSEKVGLTKAYDITVTTVTEDGNITEATVNLVENTNGYRLPTEAEWEFSARGGNPTNEAWNYTFSGAPKANGSNYTDEKNTGLDAVGWYKYNNITGISGNSDVTASANGCGTHEVGLKQSNALGIYDMSGNVWEWCWDWYDNIYKGNAINPSGPASGSARVDRGGGWWNPGATFSSVCYRGTSGYPDYRNNRIGFRVVRSVGE